MTVATRALYNINFFLQNSVLEKLSSVGFYKQKERKNALRIWFSVSVLKHFSKEFHYIFSKTF